MLQRLNARYRTLAVVAVAWALWAAVLAVAHFGSFLVACLAGTIWFVLWLSLAAWYTNRSHTDQDVPASVWRDPESRTGMIPPYGHWRTDRETAADAVPLRAPIGVRLADTPTDSVAVTVAWLPVLGATGYQVRWRSPGDRHWTLAAPVRSSSAVLYPGGAFQVQVQALAADPARTSAWSAAVLL